MRVREVVRMLEYSIRSSVDVLAMQSVQTCLIACVRACVRARACVCVRA